MSDTKSVYYEVPIPVILEEKPRCPEHGTPSGKMVGHVYDAELHWMTAHIYECNGGHTFAVETSRETNDQA